MIRTLLTVPMLASLAPLADDLFTPPAGYKLNDCK